LPSCRWYLRRNASAVRVVANSPSEVVARDVQSASRPKNQANPGRSLSPEVLYPASSPVPSCGFVATPLSIPIFAQRNAAFSLASGVVTLSDSRSS
jgi:hypothetical protein